MRRSVNNVRNQNGFTMIEIISVLIIIGIVSAVVIVRMNNTRDYDLYSQLEVVKAHLRLAQFRALSSCSPYGVNFDTSKTYYLFQGIGSNTPILFLGEDNAKVSLTTKKSDLTITPQLITFNGYGIPVDASNVTLAENVTVITNAGNITITRNTGFIP